MLGRLEPTLVIMPSIGIGQGIQKGGTPVAHGAGTPGVGMYWPICQVDGAAKVYLENGTLGPIWKYKEPTGNGAPPA